jgi:signal transduction histidine kinase
LGGFHAESMISLRVADNGKGFDPEALGAQPGKRVGLGLLGMQERSALLGRFLETDSHPGEGARLLGSVRWVAEG